MDIFLEDTFIIVPLLQIVCYLVITARHPWRETGDEAISVVTLQRAARITEIPGQSFIHLKTLLRVLCHNICQEVCQCCHCFYKDLNGCLTQWSDNTAKLALGFSNAMSVAPTVVDLNNLKIKKLYVIIIKTKTRYCSSLVLKLLHAKVSFREILFQNLEFIERNCT